MKDSHKFLIHIGYPKAASSHIQENLFKQQPEILYHNVRFPNDIYKKIYDLEENQFDHEEAIHIRDQQIIPNFDNKRINIIADERFTANRTKIEVVAQRLSYLFPGSKILIVLRNQPDILRSLYHMHPYNYFDTKKKWLPFDRWLKQYESKFEKSFLNGLYYDRTILNYQDLFGKDNVLAIFFERLITLEEDTIAQLGEFIGLDNKVVSSKLAHTPKNRSENHYLYHLKMKLIPNFSLSKYVPKKHIKFLMEKFQFQHQTIMTEDIKRTLADIYADSNQKLQNMLNVDLPSDYPL